MNDLELAGLVDLSLNALGGVAEADWSTKAGELEWSCWQTVEMAAAAARPTTTFFVYSEVAKTGPALSGAVCAVRTDGVRPDHSRDIHHEQLGSVEVCVGQVGTVEIDQT